MFVTLKNINLNFILIEPIVKLVIIVVIINWNYTNAKSVILLFGKSKRKT